MAKYIDAEKFKRDLIDNRSFFPAIVARAIEDAPAADVVSMGVLAQIQWERDFAISQLNSYGVGFAEKADVVRIVRCRDCKHWVNNVSSYSDSSPTGHCFCHEIDTLKNDFCSYGEAR